MKTTQKSHVLTQIEVAGSPLDVIEVFENDSKEMTLGFVFDSEQARLLQAAPELLQILQDVRAWLELHLEQGNINAGTANRDGDLVSQIRAAIAKAEGR